MLRLISVVLILLSSSWTALALPRGRQLRPTMKASWYGPRHAGLPTASGPLFDPAKLTCAHRWLEFGTILGLEYRGREVEVEVNDRGPARRTKRDLDVSQAAAEALGFKDAGVATLRVRWVKIKLKEVE